MKSKTQKTNEAAEGCIAIVRVRGKRSSVSTAEHTMLLLNLSRKNHCALVPDDAITRGMIAKAKDYITWGKPGKKTVETLFAKMGRTENGHALDDAYVKAKATGFGSISELADAVQSGKTRLSRVKAVKVIFRLNPPRKGFGSIKHAWPHGGLGPRDGKDIDALIASMI